jgi:hypothetical protein
MRTPTKLIAIGVLAFMELVFLSMVVSPILPRRSADIAAFMKYANIPTAENKDLWLAERRKTEKEVTMTRSLGIALGLANAALEHF